MLIFYLTCLISSHKTLVILSDLSEKDQYSKFFNSINKYTQEISYITTDEKDFELDAFGQRLYDTIIIFGHKTNNFDFKADKIKNYLDRGGSAIVFNNKDGKSIQENLYNHFHLSTFDSLEDVNENKVVFLRNLIAPTSIISNFKKPLVFEGGYAIINRPNDFRLPLVTGSMIHRSSDFRKAGNGHIARELIPIHCLQSRKGGRVCFIHSHSFAKDETFDIQVDKDDTGKSINPISNGNLEFLEEVFQWTSGYKSYLRLVNATHYDAKTKVTPHQYHIKQNITVVADITYSNGGKFLPYKGNDVQVEIFMLGTFVRHHMKMTTPGHFEDTFMIPDRPGNYKIKVFTSKFGWFNAREEMKIAVRPLNIREKEKFLPVSKPYNTAMLATMVGAFLCVIHFLYHKPTENTV